ncbi:MAG: hypothetical protein DRP32_07380 [Thermotogae bacterium]|uniref:Hydrogenase maturation nickel metallochaperone HypA n=1 Tax=Kosmotoga arenicorallina TaxID=688066 RepID=A0A7C5DUV6_9BACT|nr:hydrogenase maturation nickel metallochaperone HypA [Kosmotoga sp.]MBO8167287.1 hydrogenase maturation nickel metallochaperone HypA [Kosmotoga sp.]MCD6159355.1 hydrogenase maturation nickel metallochaperone HypA [Kosmotoga sp.]RKX48343.1 MAG: hypothetical protein DRP32_07380 [Thermotogota bacterium]HHF08324.1 hydrogenase maturation nickel metallochaperone HypA [Kosmotoga arenicorallina]
MHHELSIAEKIKLYIESEITPEELKRIRKITVGVGKLAMVDKGHIKEAFDLIKENTDFKNVEIDFVTDELHYQCRDCGNEFFSKDLETRCPECGGAIRVKNGDAIYIKAISYK